MNKFLLALVTSVLWVGTLLYAQGQAYTGQIKVLSPTTFSIGSDVTISVRPDSQGQKFLLEASKASKVRIIIEQVYD